MSEYDDFQQIAHCGGRATFHLTCDADGRRSIACGVESSSPRLAVYVGIYALISNGMPVDDFRIGGIGQGFDPPMSHGCLPVFLGSDSHGCWGHQCPECSGYFRNRSHPAIYHLTCPYCGLKSAAYKFLNSAQRAYIRHYVDTAMEGLEADMPPDTEREIVIDMDAIVDREVGEPAPDFYYVSESQQTRFRCDKCDEFNDIRGRFGYCASCGWRNNLKSLGASLSMLRDKLNSGQLGAAEAVRSAISEFDACCRDFVTQLKMRVPMKASRKAELERLVFHDFESSAIMNMKSMFDVDVLRGMSGDMAFLKMLAHRRHVFEHNGGVADERYVRESGDADARDGVLIRETQENAHRLVGCLTRMSENVDRDFHEIFTPTDWPVDHFRKKQDLRKRQ